MQLIKSKNTEQETREKLDIIEKGIARMSHQINDVMDFVRTKEPELKLWDVNSILNDCFARFNLPDSVRLTLPQKSTLIKCDRSQIEILFINLISNALKFTPPGGEVTISVEDRGDDVKVTVADSGVGMDEDKLKSLFRIDEAQSENGTDGEQGTGLGLILCKEFVDMHNGTISVTSQLESGTEFSFTLPHVEED